MKKRIKYFFWILLGSLSVFFAEVVSGSMFPFFDPWGILVIFPLYTLHILVLSYIVYRYGRPRLCTLFLAGAIFGMYESYITKVLWNPTWGDPIFSLAGVALIESMVLVLWWHPFMSFIIPLMIGEVIATSSRETLNGLPLRLRKLFNSRRRIQFLIVFFAFVFGVFQSGNSPSPVHSLLSGFTQTAFLMLLIYLWRNRMNGNKYSIRELLPTKNEFRFLMFLLLFFYVITGVYLRSEVLPGLIPQLIIWLIYLVFFVSLYFSLRKSRKLTSPETVFPQMNFTWRMCFLSAFIFTLSSAFFKFLLGPLSKVVIPVLWILGLLIGLLFLFFSTRDLLRG